MSTTGAVLGSGPRADPLADLDSSWGGPLGGGGGGIGVGSSAAGMSPRGGAGGGGGFEDTGMTAAQAMAELNELLRIRARLKRKMKTSQAKEAVVNVFDDAMDDNPDYDP